MYQMQQPSSLSDLSRMSPLHDQREFDHGSSSRVFWGTQPLGRQPLPEVRSSYPLASTSTQVLSLASTRAAIGTVCDGTLGRKLIFVCAKNSFSRSAPLTSSGMTGVVCCWFYCSCLFLGESSASFLALCIIPQAHMP